MRRKDDLPFGLVFPEAIEMQGSHLESAPFPVGGGRREQGASPKEGQGEPPYVTHTGQSIKREWFCNAEFDLTLTSPHGKTLPEKFLEAARQMAWHFWPALPDSDSLLVSTPVSSDFLAYLNGMGFRPPVFRTEPDPERLFTPFGWSREAEDLNRRYRRPVLHPERSIVAKVNSRKFGANLEAEEFSEYGKGFTPVYCSDFETLQQWWNGAQDGLYVGKGNHGFGGLGQIRFQHPDSDPALGENLERIVLRHGGIVIEAEDKIEAEFGALFHLQKDGNFTSPKFHRLLSNESGGFTGVVIPQEDSTLRTWRHHLENAAARIAKRLFRAGYFGPVGFDAYVCKSAEGSRLRPFSDLNARCTMAYAAHGLAKIFPHQAVSVLQCSAKLLKLPRQNSEWASRLGDVHFNAESRRGVFFLTPLGIGLHRHSMAIIAEDESRLIEFKAEALERTTNGG